MTKLEQKLIELGYKQIDINTYRKKIFSCIYIYLTLDTLDFYINHWHQIINNELAVEKLFYALKEAKHDVEILKQCNT